MSDPASRQSVISATNPEKSLGKAPTKNQVHIDNQGVPSNAPETQDIPKPQQNYNQALAPSSHAPKGQEDSAQGFNPGVLAPSSDAP